MHPSQHHPGVFTDCQLAARATDVPVVGGWLFERKYDGYRAQASLFAGEVRIFTRSGQDWTENFRSVVAPLEMLDCHSATLDGEICALNERGQTSFTDLCSGLRSGRQLTFFVFDILELNGRNLTKLPLIERKALLRRLLGERSADSPVQLVPFVLSDGVELLQEIVRQGHEGIVCKRTNGPYQEGERSPDWLKIKCTKRQEFIIAGWRPDDTGVGVKSLVLATREGDNLIYRGRVGAGLSHEARRDLGQSLSLIELKTCALATFPQGLRAYTRWVKPMMIAEVEFQEITPKGVVRHPAYLGLRHDKSAPDVRLETSV